MERENNQKGRAATERSAKLPDSANGREAIAHLPLEEQVATVVSLLRELPIIHSALTRLQRELPSDLQYHTVAHTESVLAETVRLALHDRLTQHEVELLAVAAAYHDLGFIESRRANEPIGARMALEAMSRHGYRDCDKRVVERAILDTALRPTPDGSTLEQIATSRLSGYLLDADLNNWATPQFLRNMLLVYREVTGERLEHLFDMRGESGMKFIQNTARLLSRHGWHTPAAHALFSAGKKHNQEVLAFLVEGAAQ